MTTPLRQIATNAGLEGAVVLNNVKEKSGDYGLDAATEQYGDMIKAGLLDPTKVVRVALQNAASVAGLLLTTESAVVEKPEKADPAAAAAAAGMGGMGDMGGMM